MRLWVLLLVLVSFSSLGKASESPNLASASAAVALVDDNRLLVDKFANRPVPVASVTKLMTALVIVESGLNMNVWLTFEERHRPAAANAWTRIRIGSQLRRKDVLRIALMASENFAAYTLARAFPKGFDGFVEAMNRKAKALGMTATRFVDPTGLSTQNTSSAADLVLLARAALKHPQIREYSTTGYFRAEFRKPRYSLSYGNTNSLVHSERWEVSLSKTGYLKEAGRCLVMVSEMDGKDVITVLLDSLGTRSPMGDAGRIKRWMATGEPGSVAKAAKRYEQEKNAALGSPSGQ